MIIFLKVKTLDSQTHEFTIDDEISVRQFKETIAEKTNISADLQRIIYCGRVLSDDKQLKEYDVNGKVVHVVERPPPSRITANSTDTSNGRQRDGFDTNIRGSPIFRALDGMVVGAMTIPVATTGGPTQANIPPLNPSSSFCMNRITVARHMLECANNIALYLENPERGLNNSSLDILTQGRWTMESTVVEVGISAAGNVEIPQNQTQNFVEALHGAVSAVLQNPNVTVVQLPTVFGSNGSTLVSPQVQPSSQGNTAGSATNENENANANANANNNAEATSNEGATQNENVPPLEGSNNREGHNADTGNAANPTWQRTSSQTLGEVVEDMRNVQTRLEPFIQQYYDILMNEPTFEENDTAGRENAQRIFDRISEALHYMAHAQHAISDLMLDLSQVAPRYLCCRPILVEQGGFVSSNNYLASFLQPNGNNNETATSNNNSSANTTSNISVSTRPVGSTTQPVTTSGQQSSTNGLRPTSTPAPTPAHVHAPTSTPGQQTATSGQGQSQNQNNIDTRFMRQFPHRFLSMTNRSSPNVNANSETGNQANPQLQVARLIQAVVNSAPLDADLHVQINAPNFLGFGVPLNTTTTTAASQPSTQPQSTSQTSTTTATTTTTTTDDNTDLNQARVTTATHPTTSTQTRSTARPQVHVANIPSSQMWNARVIPANMLSSFDRFLPCSSHHIRDTATTEVNGSSGMPHTRVRFRQRRQAQPVVTTSRSPSSTQRPSSTQNNSTDTTLNSSTENSNILTNLSGSNISLTDLVNITANPNVLNRMGIDLHDLIINILFAGAPISDENTNNAINQVIQLLSDALIFLPQYDLSDYDARASVENFIRNSLPLIINLIREGNSNEFGTRLLREVVTFVRRLFIILVTCIGRVNAELYLNQILQMGLTLNNALEQEPLRTLRRIFVTALTRDIDALERNSSDVQEFLVTRSPSSGNQNTNTNTNTNTVTPMETEEVVEEEPRSVNVSDSISFLPQRVHQAPEPIRDTEPLPSITPGSETWHNNFPNSWLPIISRDIEKQRRQNPQPPFSDAYISGMSAKRRKLVTSSKPPTEVPSLLSDGVRRAVQVVSVTNGTPSNVSPDEISAAISSDPTAQTSYSETLHSRIQDRIRTDPDFSPEKFPNSSKYFNK